MNKKQIFLLIFCGIVVLLTALLVTSYRPRFTQMHFRRQITSETQLRHQELMHQLGEAYSYMGKSDYAAAEQCLTKILHHRPNHSMAMEMLGQLYYKTGRFRKAEATFRRKIEKNEFDASAHNNLGQALYRQGRNEEALIYLLKSRDLNPSNMTVYINLSVVYSALNQHELAREMFLEAHRQLLEKQRLAEDFPGEKI